MITASIHNVRLVVATTVARGLPPGPLLAALGIDVRLLLDPDARVPAEAALRSWRVASEMTGDPAFGLTAAEHVQAGSIGALGFAIHSSATLGDGLRRLAAYLQILNPRARLQITEAAETVTLRWAADYDGPAEDLRHPLECALASVLRVARRITGIAVVPERVSFRHAAPDSTAAHTRTFGRTPLFEQATTEISFPREVMRWRTLSPDSAATAVLDRHLTEQLGKVPREDDFVQTVRQALAAELRHGEPGLDRLAARLATSERTLQRRLGREGTSLRVLLDEVRRDMAMRLLGEPRESIAEIAFLLGFSEVSAFHRAFKRWTGATPKSYRRRCASPPSARASAPGGRRPHVARAVPGRTGGREPQRMILPTWYQSVSSFWD